MRIGSAGSATLVDLDTGMQMWTRSRGEATLTPKKPDWAAF